MTSNLQKKYSRRFFPAIIKQVNKCVNLSAVLIGLSVLMMPQAVRAADDEGIEKSYFNILAGSTLVSNSSPLAVNAFADLTYASEYATSRKIQNIVTLSLFEETPDYIPADFTAAVQVRITYGSSSSSVTNIDQWLTITYSKAEGVKYNAKQYFSFNDAQYVKITVLAINAPMLGSFDTKKTLVLQNEMRVKRYFTLNTNVQPAAFTTTTPAAGDDELTASWVWPADAGNTHTQLEWTWLETELAPATIDYNLLFTNNSTRIDLPVGINSYKIPLLYGGTGKLYCRIRAVNIKKSGSRTDGPWSTPQEQPFTGHNDALNWQSTISFSDEGKRKTVIQYFDGSLRSRQSVTKDNVTNTVVTAETFYDAQGRVAVQVLPTPGSSNIISYTKNLNLFKANSQLNLPNDQSLNEDPLKFFDLQPLATPTSVTAALSTASGASNYYGANPSASGIDAYIPDAEGFPYTITRYTPDATNRIMSQSSPGAPLQLGKGHETKYYYGTPAQEELDGLFGTEVGNYTHYFKNMVQDANGQMSVNYVDMHGRTIATALAGDPPANLAGLDLANQYVDNQRGTSPVIRNLLDKNSNVVKNTSIESINSLLVPATTSYAFHYELNPQILQLTSCTAAPICYDCMYDLEIAITDESGDAAPIIRKFNNVSVSPDDDCSTAISPFKDVATGVQNNVIAFSETLLPGSYSIRKTLTISASSLQTYKQLYLTKGLCKTEQQLIDSVYNVLQTTSGCNNPPPANTCSACLTTLGNYTDYRTNYLASLNNPTVTADLEAEIQATYNKAKANCDKLCNTASQALPSKRMMMLADMMPYTGQYAKASGSGTMYDKYNIFSTVNGATQPFYKFPWNSSKALDFYRTPFNTIDPAIQPDNTLTQLNATSKDDFTDQFANSWAEALLPHHPEYDKLVFAETNLANSYNWITTFNSTTTWAAADAAGYIFTSSSNLSDPFYTVGTGYKSDMVTKLTSNYQSGLSMWQIAYGDAVCKTIVDPAQRNNCYKSASATPPYNSLTTAQKDQVWAMFRNLYAMERDIHVNAYITASVPFSDAQTLVDQGYVLQFPTSNNQLAQQYGNNQQAATGENYWAWFPASSGDAPNINNIPGGATPAQSYESRCNSYVTQWTNELSQCPAITGSPNATTIINQITAGLVSVCKKGSDASNPYGSSNVAPGTVNDGSPRSFEEVINNVFTQYNISKTNLCNPFIIEFPKPYGKNPQFTNEIISGIDTCNCKRFTQLKTEAAEAGVNPAVLSSFNEFLQARYGETLTQALFDGLNQGCPSVGTTVCYDTTVSVTVVSGNPAPCGCTFVSSSGSNNFYNCPKRICNEVNPYPLATPQPLPQFLKCGVTAGAKCVTCAQLSSLIAEFKTLVPAPFNTGPVLTGDDLTDTNIRDNVLFAQFVNYRTGFQLTWMDYVKAAATANCNLANYASNTGTQTVLCGASKPLNDVTDLTETESPCQTVYNMSVSLGQQLYKQRTESLLADFEAQYKAKCLDAVNIEQFDVTYSSKEYNYTLYYYDMAGNLAKTVPPKGVHPDFSTSFTNSIKTARANSNFVPRPHELVTNYRYNSLNGIVIQSSPDGGTSYFWYDKLARLAVSQNAQQALDGKFSYTKYDALSRVIEAGQKPHSTLMSQTISQDPASLTNWIDNSGQTKEQITFTVYDIPYPPLLASYMTQQNLRNRVSYTGTQNYATDDIHYSATFFTYDIYGNVDTLLQDYKGVTEMDGTGNRFKMITYDYDLLSGKTNMVSYQPGKPDAFYHRYKYDAENRLVNVETSRDKIWWERDAAYSYYKHGSLARTELGQLRVQGMDFAYTIQGWIKGVNSTIVGDGSFDIGKDGYTSGANSNVARDVMGYGMHYFDDNTWLDYKAIGTASPFARPGSGSGFVSLYNGNIGAISMNNAGLAKGIPANTNALPLFYNYRYDQLNRLVSMQAYKGLNAATNQWAAISITDYGEAISYDPNGNILTYNRKGAPEIGKQTDMDALTYYYNANKNQLNYINDNVAATNYSDDLDAQNSNNYTYDAIGNLKSDVAEGLTSITWSAYGKITGITKGGNITTYSYDAMGNRITKTTGGTTTIYVRDANGNVMSIYEKPSATAIQQTEIHLYGSSRLGMAKQLTVIPQSVSLASGYGTALLTTFTRNEKIFELSNHLGNVVVTVADKRIQYSSNSTTVDYYTADIITANDYYPFGMLMPGRKYAANNSYRYGFNGKENDNDVKGEGNQQDYGLRIYDPRVGRFLSVDPLTSSYPWYSPYQFAGNSPVKYIDLDGAEPTSNPADAQKEIDKNKGKLEQSTHWKSIVPDDFLKNLEENIKNPDRIAQGYGTNFCGTAQILHQLVEKDPLGYVKSMIDMYNQGSSEYRGVYMYTDNEILTAGGNLKYGPNPAHKGASGLTNHPADQMFLLALTNTYKNWLNTFSGYYSFDKTTGQGSEGRDFPAWAGTSFGKFETFAEKFLGYRLNSIGGTTPGQRPFLEKTNEEVLSYFNAELQKGTVVFFRNKIFVDGFAHWYSNALPGSHYMRIHSISLSADGQQFKLKTWDYGKVRNLTIGTTTFKSSVMGVATFVDPGKSK